MRDYLFNLPVKWGLLRVESGQDLVEYGVLIAMIAFTATAGMATLATALNTAFSTMGAALISSLG